MKTLLVLLLVLSGTQAFNLKKCEIDVEGLVKSYARAVYDWNMIVYYKQAIQEMGFALQYLGAALIDCNIFSVFSLQQELLQSTGENLANFDGPVEEFTKISDFVSDEACEEKLNFIYEKAKIAKQGGKVLQELFESLSDFMATCHVSP